MKLNTHENVIFLQTTKIDTLENKTIYRKLALPVSIGNFKLTTNPQAICQTEQQHKFTPNPKKNFLPKVLFNVIALTCMQCAF